MRTARSRRASQRRRWRGRLVSREHPQAGPCPRETPDQPQRPRRRVAPEDREKAAGAALSSATACRSSRPAGAPCQHRGRARGAIAETARLIPVPFARCLGDLGRAGRLRPTSGVPEIGASGPSMSPHRGGRACAVRPVVLPGSANIGGLSSASSDRIGAVWVVGQQPGCAVGEPLLEPRFAPSAVHSEPGEHGGVHEQPHDVDGVGAIDAGS